MAAKKKKASVPLKDMLAAIDRNDFDFYARLDKDQKKEFDPWMAMRWATSVGPPPWKPGKHVPLRDIYHYLLMVNDIVNVDFKILAPKPSLGIEGHPELQWKLLAVCGKGSPVDRGFIPPPRHEKNKLHKFLLELNPNLNKEELDLLLAMNDKDDITELAKNNGYSDEEIKELFK